MSEEGNMPVLIVGAGLAGLTLARALRRANIPAIVFEKGAKGQSASHGITLQPWSYRPLVDLLGMDEGSFRTAVAVDSVLGGQGRVSGHARLDARTGQKSSEAEKGEEDLLRANKRRLRDLLAEGADIRWEHKLKRIDASNDGVTATFDNEEAARGSWLVAADGVHSATRQQVLPSVKPEILPVVAINGSKRVSRDAYQSKYQSLFDTGVAVTSTLPNRSGLSLALSDATEQHVTISWTYTRPARDNDPLHRPDRALEEAKNVPEEFFQELGALEGLASPLDDVLDPQNARKDKLYTWLMRSVRLSDSDIDQLPRRVALVGDAAHAMPIVAGEGGNYAITDALHLAKAFAKADVDYHEFAKSEQPNWRRGIVKSEKNLSELHSRL